MNDFHFLRPDWLWALIPSLLLLLWLARRQLRSRSWQAVCDPELLPHLLLGRSVRRANWPLWLLLVGLLLALLALAGPVWQRQPQPLFRQQSALVILFDLSRSMQAADLKPSRFLRARLKVEDLLRQRKEGQTALVVFAADAFTVTPLTSDHHTIEALLKSLDPEMMPQQGSDPSRAILMGEKLLQQAGLKKGRLLLVTDEDRPGMGGDAARKLAADGFDLAVLGVGTKSGAPIPQAGGGFFKDADGNLVLPQLNVSALQQLANAGGGPYHSISVDDSDLHSLLAGLSDHRLDQPGLNSTVSGDIWREEGIWLLWPLLLLAACGFRRGWLLVLPLVLIGPLLSPAPAQALSWQDLWRTPDQRAARAFSQQDYQGAAQTFEDPRWQASALYRAGKFAAAAKLLEHPETAEDFYNRGNALAKQGDLAGAFKAYEQALKKNPRHEDAHFNKDLVEKELKKQQQQKKQPDKKQGNKNDKGNRQKEGDDQQPPSGSNQDQSQQQKPSAENEKGSQQQKPDPNQQGQSRQQDQKQQDQAATASAEDKADPQKQDEAQQAQQNKSEEEKPKEQTTAAASSDEPLPESDAQRESRLLLQQIPDDPGGLLRRKFLYQYRQRGQQTETDRSW